MENIQIQNIKNDLASIEQELEVNVILKRAKEKCGNKKKCLVNFLIEYYKKVIDNEQEDLIDAYRNEVNRLKQLLKDYDEMIFWIEKKESEKLSNTKINTIIENRNGVQ